VLLGGYELRAAYAALPKLLAVTQPEAAAELLFQGPLIDDEEHLDKQGNEPFPQKKTESSFRADDMPALCRVLPSGSTLSVAAFKWAEYTGVHAWQLKIVLQMVVTFVVSIVLNLVPSAIEGLGGRGYWILITIFVISDTTTGAIIDNTLQRFAGTLLGCIGVCITFSLGYLANGCSYNGLSVGRKVMEAAAITIWMSVSQVFASKYSPRYSKFWSINKVRSIVSFFNFKTFFILNEES